MKIISGSLRFSKLFYHFIDRDKKVRYPCVSDCNKIPFLIAKIHMLAMDNVKIEFGDRCCGYGKRLSIICVRRLLILAIENVLIFQGNRESFTDINRLARVCHKIGQSM